MRLNSISELYNLFQQHTEISTDSRNCPVGSIFFALKGDNFNANAYALSALEKGCAYAVVDEAEYSIDDRFVLVNDVLQTLQQLANYHRKQLGTTILGITGTNGKTTTKELIAAVLKEKYNILYTQGNLNNHIGVPLTLLKLTSEHQLAVVEMGANHQGEIKMLAEIACPDYGIITNVGKAHLEGFGSFEGVKKTKAELYQYIAQHGKSVFQNCDNVNLLQMAEYAGLMQDKIVMYTIDGGKQKDITSAYVADCSPFLYMECSTAEGSFGVRTNLIGAYNAENVLAAVAIGHFFKVENKQIKRGLENYVPQNNRSQFVETAHNKLIVDAYNANPSSMSLAITNFAQIEAPNKTLILGDMRELGEQSEQEHRHIVELLQLNNFQNVLLVGSEFEKTGSAYATFSNVDDLSHHLTEKQIKDSYILIKGSRGIRLEQILNLL